MNTAASVLCAIAGFACGKPVPDTAILQKAYEMEATAPASTHDKGLRIVTADCRREGEGLRHTCYVTFMSKGDAQQRLYFDAISVDRDGESWRLRSGLCRR
jgi:hypothetical protein